MSDRTHVKATSKLGKFHSDSFEYFDRSVKLLTPSSLRGDKFVTMNWNFKRRAVERARPNRLEPVFFLIGRSSRSFPLAIITSFPPFCVLTRFSTTLRSRRRRRFEKPRVLATFLFLTITKISRMACISLSDGWECLRTFDSMLKDLFPKTIIRP